MKEYREITSPCLKFNPDENLVSSAKKVANKYKKEN